MSASPPTIGIAIPCYKGHLPLLMRLLHSIELQTRRPDEVVVSCSSVAETDEKPVFPTFSFDFKIIYHPGRMNASQNRNFAASILTTDFISFIDADDAMHVQRLAALETAILNGADFIVHSYTPKTDELSIIIMDIPYLFNSLNKHMSWNGLVVNRDGYYPIHHGHSTVHRSILEKSPFPVEYRSGEDTIFCIRALRHSKKNAYINAPLSLYVPTNSWMHAPGR